MVLHGVYSHWNNKPNLFNYSFIPSGLWLVGIDNNQVWDAYQVPKW